MTEVPAPTPAPAPAATPPPAPSQPPTAAADLTLTQSAQVQVQIDALKNNAEWVAKHLAGSPETRAELQKLHELQHQHLEAEKALFIGGPSQAEQHARGAELLREQALPESVVRQYEDPASRITTKEYLDTKALANLFADRGLVC